MSISPVLRSWKFLKLLVVRFRSIRMQVDPGLTHVNRSGLRLFKFMLARSLTTMFPWSKNSSASKSKDLYLQVSSKGKKQGFLKRLMPATPGSSSRGTSPTPSKFPPSSTEDAAVQECNVESTKPLEERDPISVPSWSPLTINSKMLKELHDWNEDHDQHQSLLYSTTMKITRVMESNAFKTALDLIPNGTIPAGSVVKALVAVVALGVKIPEMKKCACDFALRVLADLSAMADALGVTPPNTDEPDSVTEQCWRDLEPFCEIVNDICKWAHEQVTSKLAFAFDDQVAFEKKLIHADTLFLKLCTIRMIRDISGIKRDVVELLRYNERTTRLKSIKAAFGGRIAHKYRYHEQGKQSCHEVTRATVLKTLNTWIRDKSTDTTLKRCRWMTSIAGAGKTAIAMTTAECLLDRRTLSAGEDDKLNHDDEAPILYAQYFCNHKNNSSNIHNFFPTLALQLAEQSPAAAHIIQTALLAHQSIAHKFSRTQAELIFMNPLRQLAENSTSVPLVVLIDGVDEFQHADGINLPGVYHTLVGIFSGLPKNVRVLILSRPEGDILRAIHSNVETEHRDITTQESLDDVRAYFSKELPALGKRHGLDFPTPDQLELLCTVASGHLGWAKQVYNWLITYLARRKGTNLPEQLELIGKLARGDLDDLYTLILYHSLPSEMDPDHLLFTAELQKVLRCLTYLNGPLSISGICKLVNADHDFDVSKCLIGLSSLYASGIELVDSDTIPEPHKSFFDFLTSRAPPDFRVDDNVAHRELASSCFRIMKDELHFNMGGFTSPSLHNNEAPVEIPGHVAYVCVSFPYHVEGSGNPFLEDILDWLKHKFLFWLEALCIFEFDASDMLQPLGKLYSSNSEVNPILVDAIKFSETVMKISVTNIYTYSIPLTPPSSLIFQNYRSYSPIAARTNGCASIEGNSHCTNAISSCGKWAAVFTKSKLSLFSITDGTSLWSTAVQGCHLLSFSPEGEVLATVSNDTNTIFIFSVRSGELQGQFNAEAPLGRISFSPLPYRHIVASAWDLDKWPTQYVAAYSVPDGKLLWDCTQDAYFQGAYLAAGRVVMVGTNVDVVDGQSGKLLLRAPNKSTDFRHFVTASPDGALLAFDRGGSIVIWSVPENTEVAVLTRENADAFGSGCFSLDSLFFAGASVSRNYHTIQVWARSTWTCVATLYGHACPISSVAFQSDGSGHIISASGDPTKTYCDGTIRIWDISAVLDGREFDIEVEKGPREVGGWFRQGIPVGGWVGDEPYVFEYPKFKLPEGVKLLDWKIDSGASERAVCTYPEEDSSDPEE